MATRYVDYVDKKNNVKQMEVNFKWCPGFSRSQMKKSVRNLHKKFQEITNNRSLRILEVSSASNSKWGIKASAFNLKVKTSHGIYKVEQLFQAGKIFQNYGSLESSLKLTPKEAKRRSFKVNKKDKLIGFGLFGSKFPLIPRTYFYDWIYLHGLLQNVYVCRYLLMNSAFTDIYATPSRTINSQSKSCAIFVSLYRKYGMKGVKELLEPKNKDEFKKLVYKI